MEKPKKEDFEYYQNGLAFKTVNLIEYTKALELYINELEALILPVVVKSFSDLDGKIIPTKYKVTKYIPKIYVDFG